MYYKTIALRLIQDRPAFHESIRQEGRLLMVMETYADWLRDYHSLWITFLTKHQPESDETQIASQALERCIQDLEQVLPPASPPSDDPLPANATAASPPA